MSKANLTAGVALVCVLSVQPLCAGNIKVDGKFISTVPAGTPPLEVDSTTLVANLNADLLDGLPAGAFSPSVGNLLTVGMTGADFTSIQAALDSITDAGIDNWYVVLVGPGVFNEAITLKNFVSVIGQGLFATRIEVEDTGNVTAVQGSIFAVLSDLWIIARSTDGGGATGVNAPIFRMQRVRVEAHTSAPGQTFGLRVAGDFNVDVFDSQIEALDGAVNTGLYMETPAQVEVVGGEIRGQSPANASATNYGVRQESVSGFGTLRLQDVQVFGSLGAVGYGIRSEAGGFTLNRCGVFGGGSTTSVGAYNATSTTFTVADSIISATGGSTEVGFQQTAGTVIIRDSVLNGDSALDVASAATARVAYSQVFQNLTGAGTFQCIGNYNLGMDPVDCPSL